MSCMLNVPNEELPILEALINIRNRLTALKKDSSEFIRSHDVQQLYQQVIKQVSRLNAVRDELQASTHSSSTTNASSTSGETSNQAEADHHHDDSPLTQTNRVDTTLNDVFALLSLFFLTIGRSRESPATFSQLSCMKQLLDHIAESGVYTEADLQPFASRLVELRDIIRKDGEHGRHPSQLTKLMMRKLEGCEKVLKTLQGTLKVLSVELVQYHQRIVSIRRQLAAAAAARPKPVRGEVKQLQEELRKIDSKRVDGKFLGPGGSSVPAGQTILVGLLEECFEICHDITVRNDEVPMTLQPIYDRLNEIKSQLEHLVLTHRWTLRETDLWNYQVTLKEIDRLRVNGKFVDSEGKQPEGQLVLLYLLRRCYGLIYRLVASSEPISEELLPISNKLSTVSKCLKEVSKYGGPFTMRDLYPYRLALHQIGNMKSKVLDKDGNDTGVRKWLGRDGSVPEGQAILRAQYEEVEQTIEELLNREDDNDDDDDDQVWDDATNSSADLSETESAASDSDASSKVPSGDMIRRALMERGGPMMGRMASDSMPTSGQNSELVSPASGAVAARVAQPSIPPRGSLISSSTATIKAGATEEPLSQMPTPSATALNLTFASAQQEGPSTQTKLVGTSTTTMMMMTASPMTAPKNAKIGRDFREGVGDLTGLSHRSPNTSKIISGSLSGSLASTSGLSSVSSTPVSVSQGQSPLLVSTTMIEANKDQLPPGAAPVAVALEQRQEAEAIVGKKIDALMEGFESAKIDVAAARASEQA